MVLGGHFSCPGAGKPDQSFIGLQDSQPGVHSTVTLLVVMLLGTIRALDMFIMGLWGMEM